MLDGICRQVFSNSCGYLLLDWTVAKLVLVWLGEVSEWFSYSLADGVQEDLVLCDLLPLFYVVSDALPLAAVCSCFVVLQVF